MFAKCSLFVLSLLSANGCRKRSKHGLFVFPPKKTLIWRRHCSIGQSGCSMTSKRSFDWLAWIFFFFFTKSHARLYPFDKPIKSFYFCSFVVSVLFVLFHFKVIRKSLYLISERHAMPVPVRTFANWIPWFFLLSTACTSAVVTLILYTFFHLLWHFSRLQNSPYFCVFKYARAVKQKVWNEAENRERDSHHTPYGRLRLARFARVRLLRHAIPISLLILRKKPDCFAV